MYSWEVVAIERDPESPFDDCRSITGVGSLVAERMREKAVDMVAFQISNENSAFHIDVDDARHDLQAVMDGSNKYVRVLDHDTPDDPLLALPSFEEYRQQGRFDDL